jgi:SAM-dependent methyltransferase
MHPPRDDWENRHRGREAGGEPEPFVKEMLPWLAPAGIAIDVAAGRGRHSVTLADHGLRVVAVDYSHAAIAALAKLVERPRGAIWPTLADLDTFPIKSESADLIVNVNYLDRGLFPKFTQALKPGGMLLVDTFLIDQAALGHPRNPRFLLDHYELLALLEGLEILCYREGLAVYPDQTKAWRASALARRKDRN